MFCYFIFLINYIPETRLEQHTVECVPLPRPNSRLLHWLIDTNHLNTPDFFFFFLSWRSMHDSLRDQQNVPENLISHIVVQSERKYLSLYLDPTVNGVYPGPKPVLHIPVSWKSICYQNKTNQKIDTADFFSKPAAYIYPQCNLATEWLSVRQFIRLLPLEPQRLYSMFSQMQNSILVN